MKKILSVFLALTLLILLTMGVSSAESNTQIDGFDECLDKIRLNSDINKDVREKILKENETYLLERINDIMSYPDYAKMKMGLKLGNDEYIEEQIRDGYSLDTDKGLLVSTINTTKYIFVRPL